MKIYEPSNDDFKDSSIVLVIADKKEGQDLIKIVDVAVNSGKLRKGTKAYKLAHKIKNELPCF